MEQWPGRTVSALSLAHRVMGLTNRVCQLCWDCQEVTRKLRSTIGELRKRASKASDLCGQDVEQLGRFVRELQMVKQQRWEEKEEKSAKCKEERRQHLKAKQGLSEQVTDPRNFPLEDWRCSTQSPCVLLQRYSQEKDKIRRMKEELRDQVAEYLKAGSRSADEKTALLSNVQQLRERLQVETEHFEHVREELEPLESVAGLSQDTVPLQSDLDRLYTEAQERRTRLAEDNAALLQQELLRMEQELALRQQAGVSGTMAETVEEAARLRRERDVLVLQLVALRKEKQEAENDLQAMHRKYRAELREHKLQALQVLHEFEEVSRRQQSTLEERYWRLLREAITDAVYLATQKHQLELGMKELRRVIAHLRDQLSATGLREELPR
ncbi:golgin subfamily A member 6-like protein 9 isoform X2 [Mobula birostris]|uniref:golgin subfamily A member 6-like protein 9 isoform X2 n=1 Tax=Mobula birostris TaxID=1983395 RepID=UPI003B281A0A